MITFDLNWAVQYGLLIIRSLSWLQVFQFVLAGLFFAVMLYLVLCPVPEDPNCNKPPTLAQKYFGSPEELAKFCKENGKPIDVVDKTGGGGIKSANSSSKGSMQTDYVDNSSSSSGGSNPSDLVNNKGGIRRRSSRAADSYSTRASDMNSETSGRPSESEISPPIEIDIETLLVDLGEEGKGSGGKAAKQQSLSKKSKKAKR